MFGHIALLGDSIFDNGVYTNGEPDVVTHLRALLPPRWRASLLAVDGSITSDLDEQLAKIQVGVTHLVISMGGNDALQSYDLLTYPVSSTAEALTTLGKRAVQFEINYRAAIDVALALDRNTTICTIYNVNFGADEALQARVGLTVFNDVILRVAFERKLSVIDLRLVCDETADYANPIEPSGRGGKKIAAAIVRSLGILNGKSKRSCVYVG